MVFILFFIGYFLDLLTPYSKVNVELHFHESKYS